MVAFRSFWETLCGWFLNSFEIRVGQVERKRMLGWFSQVWCFVSQNSAVVNRFRPRCGCCGGHEWVCPERCNGVGGGSCFSCSGWREVHDSDTTPWMPIEDEWTAVTVTSSN